MPNFPLLPIFVGVFCIITPFALAVNWEKFDAVFGNGVDYLGELVCGSNYAYTLFDPVMTVQ